MAKRSLKASSYTYLLFSTARKRKQFEDRITKNKLTKKIGNEYKDLVAYQVNQNLYEPIITLQADLVEGLDIVTKGLIYSKILPPIFTCLDRNWLHVRVSKREYSSWTIRKQKAFMRILNKVRIERNGQRLAWTWVGVNSLDGYIALKAVYSGYGAGRPYGAQIFIV